MKFPSHLFLDKKQVLICGLILIYSIISVFSYFSLSEFSYFNILPNNDYLKNWDSYWYHTIAKGGYEYRESQMSNLAFFPLFPYIWKWLALTSIEMSILNGVIFGLSISVLLKDEQINGFVLLMMITSPTWIFFVLPYSEALFFLFGTILLIGLGNRNRFLEVVGLFGASLVKSSAIVLIPAILIVQWLLDKNEKDKSLWKANVWTMLNLVTCIAAVLLVVLIQYLQTGKLFYYIEVQKYWGRGWIIPGIPFTTNSPERVLGIDAVAFTLGTIALYYSLTWIWLKAFNTGREFLDKTGHVSKPMYFSTFYVTGILLLDVFFTYNVDGSANIWSINRHLLCTPFFVLFFWGLFKKERYSTGEIIVIALLIIVGYFLTGVYQYLDLSLYYLGFFSTAALIKFFPSYRFFAIAFLIFSCYLQLALYRDFLLYKWVG